MLLSTERRLEILRQNLSQLPTQPENLSEALEQLYQVESELPEVWRMLSQTNDKLISVLSHEFLTPLTPLQGALQLLAAGKLDSGSQEGRLLLNLARKQIDKLRYIVRELLVYQQLESGQLQIVPQPCPVAELVKQAARVIQLKGKQIGVIFSLMPRLVSVWADPQLTILVLSHLLGNGIKFSPTPSIVTLMVTLSEELVRFQVKDRGVGIPAERLDKIFDVFYQVDASDSRPYNGLGLGLALAHQIIQLHGGQLWAESTLGAGSSFYLTLPVYAPARHWWLEIQTQEPQCLYYFGPFETAVEAKSLQEGYLEDLRLEGARRITVKIKQCQPERLTICGLAEIQ
ncbi:DUF1816 domain-containing protein [Myxosarcina sp. GI1(2024)]